MKVVGLLAVTAGLASAAVTCSLSEYFSFNRGRCVPAPTEGQHCNFVKRCSGSLTCFDRKCQNLIDVDVQPRRWGVHFHYLPAEYRAAAREVLVPPPDDPAFQGDNAIFEALIPNFSDIDRAIQDADELNIQKITMSCPVGTQYFNASYSTLLSQRINDDMAAAAARYPGRVTFFAHLPPPTIAGIDATLAEIDRVTSQYNNYKFGLLTQYPNQTLTAVYDEHAERYLVADLTRFQPIWEKLNEIKAIITIHPTELVISPETANELTPHPAMDYAYDTARMAHNIVTNGVKAMYPDIQIIITHGGGEYPVTNFRACAIAVQLIFQFRCFGIIDGECMMAPDDLGIFRVLPQFEPSYEAEVAEMQEVGRTFWYDLSLTTGPSLMALLDYLGPEHHHQIFYGSDAGYVSPWETGLFYQDMIKSLNSQTMYDKFELNAMIQHDNAAAFFSEFDQSTGYLKI